MRNMYTRGRNVMFKKNQFNKFCFSFPFYISSLNSFKTPDKFLIAFFS